MVGNLKQLTNSSIALFRPVTRKVISAMTEHMHQIEFEKAARGTITGYKSHSIPSEILDALMPCNMDQAK